MRKLLLIATIFLAQSVSAQSIEFVVSALAGGPNDIVTRKIVERLEKNTDLTFVVMNKPGAAHKIGYNYVQNSKKPVLIISTPEIVNNEVYQEVQEIFNLGEFYNRIYVSNKSNVKNMNDLIQLSRSRQINFGHSGIGTYSHSAMENVCSSILRCLQVPYKSGAQGMLALMTGEIDAYALVSYGNSFPIENYTPIYDIYDKNKTWLKLFAKDLPAETQKKIITTLQNTPKEYYVNMGLK